MKKKPYEKLPPRVKPWNGYIVDAYIQEKNQELTLIIDYYAGGRMITRTILGEDYANLNWDTKVWDGQMIKYHLSERVKSRSYDYMDPEFTTGSEDAIYRMVGVKVAKPMYSIQKKQEELAWERRNRTGQRHQEIVQDLMKQVEDPPKKFVQEVKETYLHHILWMTSKTEGYCSRCGNTVTWKTGRKHNDTGCCPNCRKKVVFKNKKQIKPEQYEENEILLVHREKQQRPDKDRIILRYFKAGMTSIYGKKEQFDLTESVRTYHTGGVKEQCYDKRYIHYFDNCFGGDFWTDKNLNSCTVIYGRNTMLYTGNFEEYAEVLKDAEIIKELAENRIKLPIINILNWGVRSKAEMMYKAGFITIGKQLIREYYNGYWNPDKKKLREKLGISKGKYTYLLKQNGDLHMLTQLQYLEEHGHGLSEEKMFELLNRKIDIKALAAVSIGNKLVKTGNYLCKVTGYQKMTSRLEHYKDYLDLAAGLGYDLTNDVIRYPKNLQAAHQKMVMLATKDEQDKRKKEVMRKYPAVMRRYHTLYDTYAWSNKKYVIAPAHDAADIVEEGRILHHCVGGDSYLKKHAEGKSYIFFMRRVEDPETRYYTIEYNPVNRTICQYYGKNDTKPDQKPVSAFLNKWIQEIKRRETRELTEQVQVPIMQAI